MSLTVSLLNGGTNSHPESAANFGAVATDFIAPGIVGAVTNTSGVAPSTGGFAINQTGTPNNQAQISAGTAWITGTPSGGVSQTFRVVSDTTISQTLSANTTGGTRYDWIYISLDTAKLANPGVNADDVATIVVSRSTSSSTDNGGSTPTYGYLLGIVTLANNFTTIANAAIADSRTRAGVSAAFADTLMTTNVTAKSGQHLTLIPGTSKLVKTTVLRQDDTTNTYQSGNTVMLTGWGVGIPGVANNMTETITFGVTFLQRPIVTAVYGGDNSAGTLTYGAASNTGAVKLAVCRAHAITTTSFQLSINTPDGTNWTAGASAFYQWTAIGEIA